MIIQEKKTSLLLAFCTRTAGILGGANTKEQEDLYEIGLLISTVSMIPKSGFN